MHAARSTPERAVHLHAVVIDPGRCERSAEHASVHQRGRHGDEGAERLAHLAHDPRMSGSRHHHPAQRLRVLQFADQHRQGGARLDLDVPPRLGHARVVEQLAQRRHVWKAGPHLLECPTTETDSSSEHRVHRDQVVLDRNHIDLEPAIAEVVGGHHCSNGAFTRLPAHPPVMAHHDDTGGGLEPWMWLHRCHAIRYRDRIRGSDAGSECARLRPTTTRGRPGGGRPVWQPSTGCVASEGGSAGLPPHPRLAHQEIRPSLEVGTDQRSTAPTSP